ncbi:MAG: DUF885 domain-containing protein [Caldilineaceae bacterium]|nr:DUF885 domain-containing protein [Caldilineaceae bacterium]
MTTTQTELAALIDEYLQLVFAADPIEASQLGIRDYDSTLGDHSAEAYTEEIAKRQVFLSRFHAIDPTLLDADARMDHQLALIDVRTSLRRLQDRAIWMCAPYWYVEQLGTAFSVLMRADGQSPIAQAERLWARLRLAPRYLATVQTNLTAITAPLHVEMALAAVKGLRHFLATAIPGFARQLEETLQKDLAHATAAVQSALDEFEQFLEEFHAHATGSFACGPDHFDYLLKYFHLLDLDHRQLHEFGLAQMAADREALEDYARALDPTRSWMEQIERVKDNHPQGSEFLATYHAEMVRARAHCVAAELITLPEGEEADVKWLPEYLRAGAPLGLMFTTPPFAPGLHSDLVITSLDTGAPADQQRQHMRDNCTAFARSITLHEIYPGHHTQKVHHKLATATSPMRRYFSSPVLVEGWGLYTEDLMEETGFMAEPGVRLFKLRNALWRSARVVVDSGLHTRSMRFEEAVDLMVSEVHLDRRMAEGEVRRYTTHDNPTYPSAYLLGKTAIHDLRRRWQAQQGDDYSLKSFHDTLLSYGSPPVRLIAARMLG